MGTKLTGKLLCSVTGDLAHSVSTREGIVLKGKTTVESAVAVVVTVVLWGVLWGITERVVVGIYLEFHMNVDERDIRYNGGVPTTSRDIERNIRFNFGFALADVYVPMTMGVHEIETRRVTFQRTDLKDSHGYT